MDLLSDDPDVLILSVGTVPSIDNHPAVTAGPVRSPYVRQGRDLAEGACSSFLRISPTGTHDLATPLVYLHCRYHSDPRTPVLQHVLNRLNHRGPVHALRVDSSAALSDAVTFVRAMLRRTQTILLLHDAIDRLDQGTENDGVHRYLFLASRNGAPRHPALQMRSSAPLPAEIPGVATCNPPTPQI